MGDSKYLQPPYSWGKSDIFELCYEYNTPVSSCGQQFVQIIFGLRGPFMYVYIPEISFPTGYEGATYEYTNLTTSGFSTKETYICKDVPWIELKPFVKSKDDLNVIKYLVPGGYGKKDAYERVTTSGVVPMIETDPDYISDPDWWYLDGIYGAAKSVAMEMYLFNNGNILIRRCNGKGFRARRGEYSPDDKQRVVTDLTSFFYRVRDYNVEHENNKGPNDVENLHSTNISFKTVMNKITITAAKDGSNSIESDEYKTRLPYPDTKYNPDVESNFVLNGDEYESYKDNVPVSPAANGNGAVTGDVTIT
jgi:hypothetical protein